MKPPTGDENDICLLASTHLANEGTGRAKVKGRIATALCGVALFAISYAFEADTHYVKHYRMHLHKPDSPNCTSPVKATRTPEQIKQALKNAVEKKK